MQKLRRFFAQNFPGINASTVSSHFIQKGNCKQSHALQIFITSRETNMILGTKKKQTESQYSVILCHELLSLTVAFFETFAFKIQA